MSSGDFSNPGRSEVNHLLAEEILRSFDVHEEIGFIHASEILFLLMRSNCHGSEFNHSDFLHSFPSLV